MAIVVGSTRPGRRAADVARWVHGLGITRADAWYEVVDLAAFALPLLDEAIPARAGSYTEAHTRAWAATVSTFDAFVFVTPEYNHSTSAALKNALDFLYAEWRDAAAAFVGYGAEGGVRAVEHLRQIVGELGMADVAAQVSLSLFDDFADYLDPDAPFAPRAEQAGAAAAMLAELVRWTGALRALRGRAAA